jgi:hypothetical protein
MLAAPPCVAEIRPPVPICASQEDLMALMLASVTSNKAITYACEMAPAGSKIEVIERYPSGAAEVGRVVKIRATPPGKGKGSLLGFTIELN